MQIETNKPIVIEIIIKVNGKDVDFKTSSKSNQEVDPASSDSDDSCGFRERYGGGKHWWPGKSSDKPVIFPRSISDGEEEEDFLLNQTETSSWA